MKMQKRKFRIGTLAKSLNVERFVIRFWEKEFGIKSSRSTGGQRFYSEDDFSMFQSIKDLLYNRGFTIAGAKKELSGGSKSQGGSRILASQKTTLAQSATPAMSKQETALTEKIIHLQEQLRKLRELL